MAVLGVQLVITLIMASIMQKIGKHYSLSRWLLCSTGLTRYLYPTDDELRTLAGIPKEKPKGKKDRQNNENGKISSSTFHVPRNLDIQLEKAKVCAEDIVHLRYYPEYQWLLDFSVYSLTVYTLTEVYTYFVPLKDEFNLSMLWCFLVLLFSIKILMSLTVQYFRGSESIGERSTVTVTWFAYLVVCMAILLIDEAILETGLENAYQSFNSSAHVFLEKYGVESQGPASKLILKFFLALWCATIGALFTFPGFRMARMHWDAVRYCRERKTISVLLNLSFIFPFLLILLWLRPVSKHYLTVRIFSGMTAPLLTERVFDSLRLILVLFAVLIKLVLMPVYFQAYLNIADSKLQEQKKEAGRITNVELQRKIAAVFYYMCVVALQYIVPLLMCLYFALMYKTLDLSSPAGCMAYRFRFDMSSLAVSASHSDITTKDDITLKRVRYTLQPTGEYRSTWSAVLDRVEYDECSPAEAPPITWSLGEDSSILESAQEFTLAVNSLKQVLSAEVYRGVLGFTTWWICFSWFASSSLGLIYQSYFTHT